MRPAEAAVSREPLAAFGSSMAGAPSLGPGFSVNSIHPAYDSRVTASREHYLVVLLKEA